MARILKSDKEEIIRRALADTFQVREQKVERDLNVAAHQLHQSLFTEEEHKLMKSMPKGWLCPTTRLSIRNFSNLGWNYFSIEPAVLITYGMYNNNITIDKSNVAQLAAEAALGKAEEARAQLNKDRSTLKKSLEALVFPITTDKKLSEIWPEGVKYMTPIDKSENLPALTSATVVDLMAKFKEA